MVNFPNSLDDDTTLYVAVNNLRTRLTSGITDSVTTIPVVSTAGFPATGFTSILTGGDITDTEAIEYTSTNATNFLGATRGAGGTTAVAHDINDFVDLTIVAPHHNVLKDGIIELEHFVGVSGSENFVVELNDLQQSVTLAGTNGTSIHVSGQVITVSGGDDVESLNGIQGIVLMSGTEGISTHISGQGILVSGTLLTVREVDSDPNVANVDTIVVSNGTLTDDGDGQVTIEIAGGSAGAPAGDFSGALLTTSGHDIPGSFIPTWTGSTFDTDGFFSLSEPSRLTVPNSTITHVLVSAQSHFNPSVIPTAGNSSTAILFKNGAQLFPDVRSKYRWIGVDTNSRVDQFSSYPLPVTSGHYFEMQINDPNTTGNWGLTRTWFSIEDVTPKASPLVVAEIDGGPSVSGVNKILVSNDTLTDDGEGQVTITTGGGGGGDGPWFATFTTASGATQNFNNSALDKVTIVTDERTEAGGFSIDSGVLTVPVGSGFTHARLFGQVTYESDAAGIRDARVNMNGVSPIVDYLTGKQVAGSISRVPGSPDGLQSLVQVNTPIIPISGGTQFELRGFQNSGGPIDVQGGATGTFTFLSIEGFKQT